MRTSLDMDDERTFNIRRSSKMDENTLTTVSIPVVSRLLRHLLTLAAGVLGFDAVNNSGVINAIELLTSVALVAFAYWLSHRSDKQLIEKVITDVSEAESLPER
jgi:hypothetical protein